MGNNSRSGGVNGGGGHGCFCWLGFGEPADVFIVGDLGGASSLRSIVVGLGLLLCGVGRFLSLGKGMSRANGNGVGVCGNQGV